MTYPIKIITPDGIISEGKIKSLVARTTLGDVCILKGHADFVSILADGTLKITDISTTTTYHCNGGFLCVLDGSAVIISTKIKPFPTA